ncbi:hypothetical protein Ahia01_001057700 [Argonauta hians]
MSGQTAYSRPDSYDDDYKHHLLNYYEHYYLGLSTTSCSSSSPSIASLFISKFPSCLKCIVLVAALLLSMPSLCFAGETQNSHIEDYCHQVGPCQCRMLNHSGEINLKKVAFFNGKPRFVISLNDTYSVAYNPCVGFSLDPTRSSQYQSGGASHECDDAAVCVFRVGDKDSSYSNLGKSNSAMFQFDPDSNKFFIAYTSPDSKFKTDVYLQCRPVDQLSVIKLGERNQSLSLLLQSVCACPGACSSNTNTTTATSSFSPGSYILILFFTLFFLYLFLGILYQRIVYSAEGSELLPNREGWHSFFSLVKDGYLFFISPCLGNTVEYRYYQRL